MPLRSFFDKRKRKESGNEIDAAPIPLTRTESISSVASDATAPNLEGAGRTVGLLLDFLGTRLEGFLNGLASRHDLTPEEIVPTIRSIASLFYMERERTKYGYEYDKSLPPLDAPARLPTKKQTKFLAMLCKKLYKLTESPNSQIQLLFIEEITNLAIDHPALLRPILAQRRFDRYFRPRSKESDVLIATAKMHNSVKISRLFDFLDRYSNLNLNFTDYSNDGSALDPYQGFTNGAKELIWDPSVSFIMARRLMRTPQAYSTVIYLFYLEYAALASTNPHEIEWENIGDPYNRLLLPGGYNPMSRKGSWRNVQSDPPLRRLCYQLIHQKPDYIRTKFAIPQIDLVHTFKPFSSIWSIIVREEKHESFLSFLEAFVGTPHLRTQLARLRYLDQETKTKLKGTIFDCEPLIAYQHIFNGKNRTSIDLNFSLSQMSRSDVFQGCCVLADNVVQESGKNHEHGVLLAQRILSLSRYFKQAMLSALAHCRPNSVPKCQMPCEWEGLELPLARENLALLPRTMEFFRTVNDNEICFPTQTHRTFGGHKTERDQGLTIQKMKVDLGQIVFIKVVGREKAFDMTGHYPVIAESNRPGEEKYVACLFEEDEFMAPLQRYFTVVKNGAREAVYRRWDEEMIALTTFYVMVLRYDPSDALPPYPSIPKDAIDPTGPLFWVTKESDDDDIGVEGAGAAGVFTNVFPIMDLLSNVNECKRGDADNSATLAGEGSDALKAHTSSPHPIADGQGVSSRIRDLDPLTSHSEKDPVKDVDNLGAENLRLSKELDRERRRTRKLERLLAREKESKRIMEDSLAYWEEVRAGITL